MSDKTLTAMALFTVSFLIQILVDQKTFSDLFDVNKRAKVFVFNQHHINISSIIAQSIQKFYLRMSL